jgi:hypothetical protein
MFRRRDHFQDNPLSANQLALLVKANQLISDGKPLDAGPLFAQVAGAMQRGNHPRRAANLFARAAHAFADGNDEQAALGYARTALALFTQFKMVRRSPVFFTNITHKMIAKGMNGAADTLHQEFGTQIAALPVVSQQENRPPRGILPTNCPKCGATIHSDAVDWVDDNTVECEYCGTFIRIEK